MSREKEIFEQRSQIMTLLLDNLISGGHISIPLAQMGVDLTGTTCFCVYLIGGQSLLSDDGDELIVAGERLKVARPRKKEFMKAFASYYGGSA